jgi:hypothetical protein
MVSGKTKEQESMEKNKNQGAQASISNAQKADFGNLPLPPPSNFPDAAIGRNMQNSAKNVQAPLQGGANNHLINDHLRAMPFQQNQQFFKSYPSSQNSQSTQFHQNIQPSQIRPGLLQNTFFHNRVPRPMQMQQTNLHQLSSMQIQRSSHQLNSQQRTSFQIQAHPQVSASQNQQQAYNQGTQQSHHLGNRALGNKTVTRLGTKEAIDQKKDEFLKRKEKMNKMKEFFSLKGKLMHHMNAGNLETAKTTYDTMYSLYQDMVKRFSEPELITIKNSISDIYAKLQDSMNKKKIKKGHFLEVEKNDRQDDKRKYRRKIVTTDLDVLMQLVEEKHRINLAEIQAKFNVSKRLAEEWIQMLADYGLVEIKYLPIGGVEISKLTRPMVKNNNEG